MAETLLMFPDDMTIGALSFLQLGMGSHVVSRSSQSRKSWIKLNSCTIR